MTWRFSTTTLQGFDEGRLRALNFWLAIWLIAVSAAEYHTLAMYHRQAVGLSFIWIIPIYFAYVAYQTALSILRVRRQMNRGNTRNKMQVENLLERES